MVKDDNGNVHRVHVTDPRYVSGEFKHILNNSNKIIAKTLDGITMQVEQTDIRLQTGELLHVNKNRIYVHHPDTLITRRIEPSELDIFLSNGYVLGPRKKTNAKRIWIHHPNTDHVIRINEDDLITYEMQGYEKGRVFNYKGIIICIKYEDGANEIFSTIKSCAKQLKVDTGTVKSWISKPYVKQPRLFKKLKIVEIYTI